jgi:hypothetical protein
LGGIEILDPVLIAAAVTRKALIAQVELKLREN